MIALGGTAALSGCSSLPEFDSQQAIALPAGNYSPDSLAISPNGQLYMSMNREG